MRANEVTMDGRNDVVTQTRDLLEKERFNVTLADSRTSCFDLLARRRSFTMMLKFLLNIDSCSVGLAGDLKTVSNLFSACPLLIGERTRHQDMQDGVLYGRYGVNAVTPQTLFDVFSIDQYPVVNSSRGGYCVRIDGELLKRIRIERGLSVGELADGIGVSRTMIYSYEHSGFGATLSTVVKLEELLDEPLALPIEVFSIPPLEEHKVSVKELEKNVFLLLERIGFKIYPINRAPFDAVTTSGSEFMLTKVDSQSERCVRDLKIIRDVSSVAVCPAFVVTSSPDAKENFEGVPVIKNSELEEIKTPGEFLETLERRS